MIIVDYLEKIECGLDEAKLSNYDVVGPHGFYNRERVEDCIDLKCWAFGYNYVRRNGHLIDPDLWKLAVDAFFTEESKKAYESGF